MNGADWTMFVESYKTALLALADICDHVARHSSGEEFSRVLIEAYALGWLQEDALANMGMVNRSSANRWINGAARPSKLQQRVIMQELAKVLRDAAKEIKSA